MPATDTDSTSPNPLSPATSSGESPLAAHSSSADMLAPVTTAGAGLGALGVAASPLLPSPLRVLAASCAGTVRGVTTASGCRGKVPLPRPPRSGGGVGCGAAGG